MTNFLEEIKKDGFEYEFKANTNAPINVNTK